MASGPCARILNALKDCKRKHPRDPFICQHLTATAGWCMWSNLCPQEVRGIEDCIGVASSAGTAPRIPPRCASRVALLEACIEAHQLLADERTDRCTGPQPIGPATPAAAAGGAEGKGGAGGASKRSGGRA